MFRHLFLIVLALAVGEITGVYSVTEKQYRLCGSNLDDMMSLVCDGIFASKRSKSPNQDLLEFYYPENFWDFNQIKGVSQLPSKRSTYGLATQCCYFGCTKRFMKSHCG